MSRRKRRSYIDTPKADAVRRHLKDQVPASQIADELDVQPTAVHSLSRKTSRRSSSSTR